MNRRYAVWSLAALAASASFNALGQAMERPRRIGYLSTVTADADLPRFAAFRRTLADAGYVEGRNLVIEARNEGDAARLATLAKELLQLRLDLLVTIATPATLAAKNATRDIPIVFSGVGDPVAFGVVDSLRRPGRNLTGVANIVPDLAGKRLEMLKRLMPKLEVVGVTLEQNTPVSVLQWKESQLPARDLGIRLHVMQVSDGGSYETAFADAARAGVSAVAVSLSPTASSNAARIANLGLKHRLPTMFARSNFVDAGGLMSYGAGFATDGRVMALLAAQIFRGAKPEDLPVQQPTEFELVINMRTARQLGLTVPQSVLLGADRVIE